MNRNHESERAILRRTRALADRGLILRSFAVLFAAIVVLWTTGLCAQTLVPKRPVPQRPQPKTAPLPHTPEVYRSESSLIQLVSWNEDAAPSDIQQAAGKRPVLSTEDLLEENSVAPSEQSLPIPPNAPNLLLSGDAAPENASPDPANPMLAQSLLPYASQAGSANPATDLTQSQGQAAGLVPAYGNFPNYYGNTDTANAQAVYNQQAYAGYYNPYAAQQAAYQYPYANYAAYYSQYPGVNPYYANAAYGAGQYAYPNIQVGYQAGMPYPPGFGHRPHGSDDEEEDEDEESGSFSPLYDTTRETLCYFNPLKSPKGPNRGVGGPMMMRSWTDRQYYAGIFGGVMFGSELIDNLVDQDCGGSGGVILGWNCDHYWGLEARLFYSALPEKATNFGQSKYAEYIRSLGGTYVPPLTLKSSNMTILDLSVHYYPLGNAKWRPFLTFGLGTVYQTITDLDGSRYSGSTLSIPFGCGLKYWWNERIAIQADLVDNVILSSQYAKTQNNVAVTFGLTFPIGKINKKHPTVYWPQTPSSGQ